jgi:hypothetical protein
MASEIARRRRFHEEMSSLPSGVRVYVLPTGGGRLPSGSAHFRHRDQTRVGQSIESAYAASASYLADRSTTRLAKITFPWLERCSRLALTCANAAVCGVRPQVKRGQPTRRRRLTQLRGTMVSAGTSRASALVLA